MASKGVIERNKAVKRAVVRYAATRERLKLMARDKTADISERLSAQFKLDALPRSSSSVRFRSRCSMTGRGRGCYRKFGLSRIKFRELAMEGMLPGVRKASW